MLTLAAPPDTCFGELDEVGVRSRVTSDVCYYVWYLRTLLTLFFSDFIQVSHVANDMTRSAVSRIDQLTTLHRPSQGPQAARSQGRSATNPMFDMELEETNEDQACQALTKAMIKVGYGRSTVPQCCTITANSIVLDADTKTHDVIGDMEKRLIGGEYGGGLI